MATSGVASEAMLVVGNMLAGHACSLLWSPGRCAWWWCSLPRNVSQPDGARVVAGLAGDVLLCGGIISLAWMLRGGWPWRLEMVLPDLDAGDESCLGTTLDAPGWDGASCVW